MTPRSYASRYGESTDSIDERIGHLPNAGEVLLSLKGLGRLLYVWRLVPTFPVTAQSRTAKETHPR